MHTKQYKAKHNKTNLPSGLAADRFNAQQAATELSM